MVLSYKMWNSATGSEFSYFQNSHIVKLDVLSFSVSLLSIIISYSLVYASVYTSGINPSLVDFYFCRFICLHFMCILYILYLYVQEHMLAPNYFFIISTVIFDIYLRPFKILKDTTLTCLNIIPEKNPKF